MVFLLFMGVAQAADDDLVELGRRIYMQGILPSGEALSGLRFGGVKVLGREAACVQCHRRSGMGAVEGEILVAPITAGYLFSPPDKMQLATMDARRSKSFNMTHPPYDDVSLAAAIRTGLNANGQSMNDLMPRYPLDDGAVRALLAYLRQLNSGWSPGVGDQSIRLATIIAPSVEPSRKKVFIDMLRTAVQQKNASTVVGPQRGGRHHMTSAAELVLGTERKWELDIWELDGPESSWRGQLERYYTRSPVFAVLSGISDGAWQPVHDFCESRQVPCWFPIVDAQHSASDDFYSVYFSEGVLLEAAVVAGHATDKSSLSPIQRIVQVHADNIVGRAAASALTTAARNAGVRVDTRVLKESTPTALSRLLLGCNASDAVMLWFSREEAALLPFVPPPAVGRIYLSGQLLDGEHGVPPSWKKQVRLVYPYELPQKRSLSLSYFHQWLRLRRLPLIDEPMQSKVFFAANFLTDTLAEMLENLYREYLLERAENMISRREGSKAEDEAHSRQMLRRAGRAKLAEIGPRGEVTEPEEMGLRQSTTVFPRLGLGAGQRFASKGAYIVRFVDTVSDSISADTGWIVP